MSQTAAAPKATVTIASHKIQPRHLERSAVVYVRQSTVQQILRHQESTKIQYGLADLAERLGWIKEQVVVIDDDLGVSGASSEGRAGFQRLLADVALDRVGLILGVEMSRLARSCKDWYQLLELCSVYGTLIGDLDGLYDPAQYNDRLLLGLKGTMSEAELHVLRQRLQQGQMAKARRGELGRPVPIGYVRRSSGEVALDPDEEVRATVRLIFEQFDRIGTVGGVLKYLATQGIKLGVSEDVERSFRMICSVVCLRFFISSLPDPTGSKGSHPVRAVYRGHLRASGMEPVRGAKIHSNPALGSPRRARTAD